MATKPVPIEVTREALVAINDRLQGHGHVRLGVTGGGCIGYRYVVACEAGGVRPDDVAWTLESTTFAVDERSLTLLSGSTLSFRRSLVNDGFRWENPNEASRCGCGASFSVKRQ